MIPHLVIGPDDKTVRQEMVFTVEKSNPILPIHESLTVQVSPPYSDGVPGKDIEEDVTHMYCLSDTAPCDVQLYALKLIADMTNEHVPQCKAHAEMVKGHLYLALYEWDAFSKWILELEASETGFAPTRLAVFEEPKHEKMFRQFLSYAIQIIRQWKADNTKPAVVIKF